MGLVPKTSCMYPIDTSKIDIKHVANMHDIDERFHCNHIEVGYGSQRSGNHVFYRTSNSDYGWFAPNLFTLPPQSFPQNHSFTSHLAKCGMYRNFSLNI